MKKTLFALTTLLISFAASAQFVARMEVKEPIPGICNDKEVYAMLPMKGQEEAVCPLSVKDLEERLNTEVTFLKDHPDYNDKGMMGLVINCKGVLVKCEIDNKTQSPELDKQIEAVFKSLTQWKPGRLNKEAVDTSKLYSFTIKNGKIKLS